MKLLTVFRILAVAFITLLALKTLLNVPMSAIFNMIVSGL